MPLVETGQNNHGLTQNEILLKNLRQIRDERLVATDYLLMPDYPLADSEKLQLVAYRQELRDLPGKAGSPWDGGGENTPWPNLPKLVAERKEKM